LESYERTYGPPRNCRHVRSQSRSAHASGSARCARANTKSLWRRASADDGRGADSQHQRRVATNASIPASPVACCSGGGDGDATRDAGLASVTICLRGPFRIHAERIIGGTCRQSGARSGGYGSRRRFSDGGRGNGPRDPEPLTVRPDQRGMLIAVVNASGSVNSSKSSAQDYER
jgi:hypothetical protein